MSASPSKVAALRTLLAARFPERHRSASHYVATGIQPIDAALGGGLPAGKLTELVSLAPSTGGQTVLEQILRTTRAARERVALIDGADGFSPEAVPPDFLRHLVWVRGRTVADAFAAADILVRDGNYAAILLDLRGLPERSLLKTPGTLWHRLRHAAELSPAAVLVHTTTPLVPAVPWRIVLSNPVPLHRRRTTRSVLADTLTIEIARGAIAYGEKIA